MSEDPWGVDEFNEILSGLADARVDDAARSRSRRAWITQQVEGEVTLVGFLANLAGTSQEISVTLTGGTELRGTIRAVGADVMATHTTAGVALIPLSAVLAIRADDAAIGVPTAPNRVRDRNLGEVLADAAADRREVQVITSDGARNTGQLRAVGVDVVTLRVGESGNRAMVIAQAAVVACILLDAR